MEKITDIPFVEGFVRMCSDGWKQGWHERNGGNFSYRMKETEVEQVKDFLCHTDQWEEIGLSLIHI